jgi:hypothetical protein
MSYVIYYKLQYIKVGEDRYVPVILQGDNNCYNCNNKSRARDWNYASYLSPSPHDKISLTAEEIKNTIQKWYDDDKKRYVDNVEEGISESNLKAIYGWYGSCAIYGHHTSGTTWKMVYNFFVNKIKKALTVEELINKGVSISVRPYSYDYSDNNIGIPNKIYPKTTMEFLNAINASVVFIETNKGFLDIKLYGRI